MNLATLIVLLFVLVIFALLTFYYVKKHRLKKSGCGGGCSSCPYCKSCQH